MGKMSSTVEDTPKSPFSGLALRMDVQDVGLYPHLLIRSNFSLGWGLCEEPGEGTYGAALSVCCQEAQVVGNVAPDCVICTECLEVNPIVQAPLAGKPLARTCDVQIAIATAALSLDPLVALLAAQTFVGLVDAALLRPWLWDSLDRKRCSLDDVPALLAILEAP